MTDCQVRGLPQAINRDLEKNVIMTYESRSFAYRGQFLHLWELINYGITCDTLNKEYYL